MEVFHGTISMRLIWRVKQKRSYTWSWHPCGAVSNATYMPCALQRQFWELLVGSFPLALAALANHGSKLSRLNPGAVDVIRIEVNGAIWQLIALFLFATLFWIWKPWTLKKPWGEGCNMAWVFKEHLREKKHGVYLGYRAFPCGFSLARILGRM